MISNKYSYFDKEVYFILFMQTIHLLRLIVSVEIGIPPLHFILMRNNTNFSIILDI